MPDEYALNLKDYPIRCRYDRLIIRRYVIGWNHRIYRRVCCPIAELEYHRLDTSPRFPDILAAIRLIRFSTWRRIRDDRRTREPAGADRHSSHEGAVRERNATVIAK